MISFGSTTEDVSQCEWKRLSAVFEQDLKGYFEYEIADKIHHWQYRPKNTRRYDDLLVFDDEARKIDLLQLKDLWGYLIRDGFRPSAPQWYD